MSNLKYHVLLINGNDLNITILYTTDDKPSCYQFMSEYLKDKNLDNRNTKAYHESENIICIYDYHYIFSKTLKYKIILIEYRDID